MAPVNRVKERLEGGETVFGTWLQTASPMVANILAHGGMDFVTVDMELFCRDVLDARHNRIGAKRRRRSTSTPSWTG